MNENRRRRPHSTVVAATVEPVQKIFFDLVFGSGDGGAAVHPCNRIAPPVSTPRQLQGI
jgi:hypothetical protein